jgi:hypothetical protein
MNQATFSKLVELSHLPDAKREAAFDQAPLREIQDYLRALDLISSPRVPAPSASKKWAGRNELLQAVEADRAERTSTLPPPLRWLRMPQLGLAAAGVSAALLISSAGAGMTGWSGTGGAFSEVLSALGLQSQDKTEPPVLTPGSPTDVPGSELGINVTPTPVQGEEPANVNKQPQDSSGEPEAPAVVPPGQVREPPGQGGENPGNGGGNGNGIGQGGTPAGQGGESPGQGVDPPGQGGENPGQGVDPPGHGGEKPGQGVDPQGQGGENLTPGTEYPGSGSEIPDQGSGNQGQGSQNPGQGGGSQGGGGNSNNKKP